MAMRHLVLITSLLFAPTLVAAQATEASPFDTLSVFVGPDGSKQPQDLGINAHMGLRTSANWAAPLLRSAGLGVQAGLGVNFSDAAVHVLDQIGGPSSRRQVFLTLGAFQRAERGLEWAVAYDNLYQSYYDTASLAQVRAKIGYDLRASDQVGVNWRTGVRGADVVALDTPVRLDPISQLDVYHRHIWATGVQTTVWIGGAGGHDNVVWVFPEDTRDERVLVYGASLFVPLNDRFAIFGASNLITPTATGTVDAFLGVSWFPGRGAQRTASQRFAPALAVANNTEFAVDVRR